MIDIKIKGLNKLNKKLRRAGNNTKPAIKKATRKAVLYIHSQVPPYPPPLPNSDYRRTGTLGRSITTEVRDIGSQTVGLIGSAVIYAPDVISAKKVGKRGPQKRIHKGRWYTLQGVVKKAHKDVLKIYRKMIAELLKK